MMMTYTIEECQTDALKYNRRIDYLNENRKSYTAAYKHGWLDEICSHMEISIRNYNVCIYAYEFLDNRVYVGITRNLKIRDRQHRSYRACNDSYVMQHMIYTNLNPRVIRLTTYMDHNKATIMEQLFIERYKNDGWIILNENTSGSSNLIYTKEKCKEIIDSYTYISDLYSNHARVLQICKKNGWFLDEINNLIKKKKERGHWNRDRCAEIANQYKNQHDFSTEHRSVYNSALKNGFLSEINTHMKVKKGRGYWTKERCFEESKKYKNRFSFQKGSRGAYKASYENKWLDEFFK